MISRSRRPLHIVARPRDGGGPPEPAALGCRRAAAEGTFNADPLDRSSDRDGLGRRRCRIRGRVRRMTDTARSRTRASSGTCPGGHLVCSSGLLTGEWRAGGVRFRRPRLRRIRNVHRRLRRSGAGNARAAPARSTSTRRGQPEGVLGDTFTDSGAIGVPRTGTSSGHGRPRTADTRTFATARNW